MSPTIQYALIVYLLICTVIASHATEHAWPLFKPYGWFGRLSGMAIVFFYHFFLWFLQPAYRAVVWTAKRINRCL